MKRRLFKHLFVFAALMFGANVSAQTYCVPTTTNTDDYLSLVSSVGAETDFTYTASSQPAGSYADETALTFESYETQTFQINTDYFMVGANGVNVWIDWNNDFTFDAIEKVGSSAGYNSTKTFNITVPAGTAQGTYRMRVRGQYGDSADPDACASVSYGSTVDLDLEIVAPPACLNPTSLIANNITATSADLAWSGNGASTFNVEYGVAGFSQGNGTMQTGVTSNTYNITIAPTTSYEFYVQSDCGSGVESGWSGPFLFSNQYCEYIGGNFQPHGIESFQTTGGVTNISNLNSGIGTTSPNYSDFTSMIVSGSENQQINFTISSTPASTTSYAVFIDWGNDYTFDASDEVYSSGSYLTPPFSNSFTVPTGTPIGQYRMRVIADASTMNPDPCGGGGASEAEDYTFEVIAEPACIQPTSLIATNITPTSVDLGWVENNTATSWNIEYGIQGFSQGNGTTVNGVTSNPESVVISPDSKYDFYVQSVCGPTEISAWAGPFSFSNTYCDYYITGQFPDYIRSFETNGAITDITNLNSGLGTTSIGYSDFTSMVVSGFGAQQIDFTITGNGPWTYGFSVFIDWNNDFIFDASEQVYNTATYEASPLTSSFSVPAGTPLGEYRMRVIADNMTGNPGACVGGGGEAEDYTFEVVAAPNCIPSTYLTMISATETTAEVAWIENGTATTWNLEYGPAGFTQGSGTEIPGITTNPYTITGLTGNTEYDFYIQADCGINDSSDWSNASITFRTDCGAIDADGYCESFDNNSSTLNCWTALDYNGDGYTWDFTNYNTNSGSGNVSIFTDGNNGANDDYLISPAINLTGAEALNFYYRVMSATEPNDFQLLLSTTGNQPADFQDTLMDLAQYSNITYKDTTVDLSAYVGTVYIAFHVPAGGADGWVLFIDDICFGLCVPVPGEDGTKDVCVLEENIDLNDGIIVNDNPNGRWEYLAYPGLIHNGSDLNVANMAEGTHEVLYIVDGLCDSDTTIATVNIYKGSSAGQGGAIDVCLNEPVNLYSLLTGNVDFGGEWFDEANNLLTNSQPNAPGTEGAYEYTYITSNGVCPNDTAVVTVNVKDDCNLSLGEDILTDLSVYPNPATSQLTVLNPSDASSLKVEMLDMNGRVVLIENKVLNNATEATLAIEHLEKGIYTLRIYNNEGQKTFKIVKQ